MPLVAGDQERVHVGDGGIVAEDAGDGVDERALAVRAGAVGENENVLMREAGATVADIALQEFLQLTITRGHALKECAPQWMRRTRWRRRARSLLGDVIERVGRSPDAGAQVIGCVQGPLLC